MKVKQIEFQFKGERNYIHGTDMFNAMIATHSGIIINNIRFTAHDFVHSPICQLYQADSKEALNNIQDIRARCQFDVNGITHWLALTQMDVDATPANRYEYDEEQIISLCRMEGEGIVLTQHSPFTFIENIVAMNKHMHQQLFPDALGKWIFTRIDLVVGCDVREKLALQLKHNMNYRLTKSDILVDGKKVGDIFFSLVKS
jgi:hypothetical protein